MREIKFRAWDGKNMREWGFLYKGAFVGIPTESGALDYPQMQYTGLKDKNDKEIYEGDIIKAVAGEEYKEDSRTERVIFGDDLQWALKWDDVEANNGMPLSWGGYESFEVIGNIYEHPELIKT